MLNTELFPFPHIVSGQKRDGSILRWPDQCKRCNIRTCDKPLNNELSLCSYGYNFYKVTNEMVIAGILVSDVSFSSKARTKRFLQERRNAITKEMLDNSVLVFQQTSSELSDGMDREKQEIIRNYIKKEQYRLDFLESLKPEIQKGLSFVHDYKQINTQIGQNINAIIETKYTGDSLDEKLAKASREEKAIYAASKFLEEKLNVTKFLLHPEWLDIRDQYTWFRFHGIVIKYVRIYTPRFEAKKINVSIIGTSHSEIFAHPQAVSVIPHTFLDNAAKYSPKAGRVEIYVQDLGDCIDFSVSSYGPRVYLEEEEKIFQPFTRGKEAQIVDEEGAGVGLYISQLIAVRHFGTRIQFSQKQERTANLGHWTTFSVKLPLQVGISQGIGPKEPLSK